MTTKYSHHHTRLAELKKKQAYRQIRTLQPQSHKVSLGQQELINFSSNDYLGLAADTELQERFFNNSEFNTGFNKSHWMSASSSRVLTGTSTSHTKLENLIAQSYNKSGALLFNSGYHANTGILPALTDQQDLILADKLVHASLIDGLKLGQAKFKRYAHNDMGNLARLLDKHRSNYRDVWIVTESLFSMDGDLAPLVELVELKKKHQCYLYVDEAHSVGCFGERGLGLSEQENVVDDIDLLVGTFGKALASCGGFVTGDQTLIEALVNYSRSWLFSTALPPVNIDWNIFIWQQLADFKKQRDQLDRLTQLFRDGLNRVDKESLGSAYIVPVIEAGNEKVVALADKLQAASILAMPIRSPTVRSGSERLRFSLTANIPESAIEHCLDTLNGYIE